MATAIRWVGGVVLGLVVAFALVALVEVLSTIVHPFPADFQGTHEEICRHVERYPAWVLAAVVVAWGVTAFVGTWTARRVGNSRGSAMVVGVLLLAALTLNLSMLPYPLWFKITSWLVLVAAAVRGCTRPGGEKMSGSEASAVT